MERIIKQIKTISPQTPQVSATMLVIIRKTFVYSFKSRRGTVTSIFRHRLNTLRPRQNGHHFPDDIFKWIFLNENVWISINISLKFIPRGPNNNIPTLVKIMAWRRPGDKPLSEPMMVRFPTHICVTRPQWVNGEMFAINRFMTYIFRVPCSVLPLKWQKWRTTEIEYLRISDRPAVLKKHWCKHQSVCRAVLFSWRHDHCHSVLLIRSRITRLSIRGPYASCTMCLDFSIGSRMAWRGLDWRGTLSLGFIWFKGLVNRTCVIMNYFHIACVLLIGSIQFIIRLFFGHSKCLLWIIMFICI